MIMLFTFGLLTLLSPVPTQHRVDEFDHPAETQRERMFHYTWSDFLWKDTEANTYASFMQIATEENHTGPQTIGSGQIDTKILRTESSHSF